MTTRRSNRFAPFIISAALLAGCAATPAASSAPSTVSMAPAAEQVATVTVTVTKAAPAAASGAASAACVTALAEAEAMLLRLTHNIENESNTTADVFTSLSEGGGIPPGAMDTITALSADMRSMTAVDVPQYHADKAACLAGN